MTGAKEKSVLLFGAYRNGNIGDQFQASSVASHIRSVRPDLAVDATSNSRAERDYEFEHGRKVEPLSAIGNAEVINAYSALVIGGGGLLASVHRPLNSVDWVEKIQVPIVLLSLGASEEIVEKCRPLIERAAVVSGRDAFSCELLSKIRSDVRFVNDPILTDPRLDREEDAVAAGDDKLIIIPRKQTDRYRVVYEALAAELAPTDEVVSMFPATDEASGVFASFPSSRIATLTEMAALCSEVDRASMVVSSRYHGCIIALKRGVPCIGTINSADERSSKIGELFKQVGHEHLLVSFLSSPHSRADIMKAAETFDRKKVSDAIAAMEASFRTSVREILDEVV